MRIDGRDLHALRPLSIEPDFIGSALGSVLVSTGGTRVICTASVERAPKWLRSGGWVTADYVMLPGSTSPRGRRDPGGRGKEIQRLIGRSLRAAMDMTTLVNAEGEGFQLTVDCDVIEADGGTRTASITGGWVALALAVHRMVAAGELQAAARDSLKPVSAVSVGVVPREGDGQGVAMLDLNYHEDSRAEVDLNVVALADGNYVEVQGTGEKGVFGRDALASMLDAADAGLPLLRAAQLTALQQGLEKRGSVRR